VRFCPVRCACDDEPVEPINLVNFSGGEEEGAPSGGPYEWFQRAQEMLSTGNADAAIVLLERVRRTEPSPSVLEALGRALFDARRYDQAIEVLTELVERAHLMRTMPTMRWGWRYGVVRCSPRRAIICRWRS
jgi:tetratricopeptide (TPR) repeat protein